MTETELLTAYIEDKIRQSEDQYRITSTGFLSAPEQRTAVNFCRSKGARHRLYGGYADAERAVLLLLPDYIESDFTPDDMDDPLCLLVCHAPASARALSHRDYLGSLLALGLKRDVIGDILVREGGADILVLKSISAFLLSDYKAAGSVPLACEIKPISELIPPEIRTETVRESIASARLDNLLSAAFGISRSDAVEAIARGIVFVNDAEAAKPDARVEPGDKLVLRGRGKAIFDEICGTTRKGRLSVSIRKFL